MLFCSHCFPFPAAISSIYAAIQGLFCKAPLAPCPFTWCCCFELCPLSFQVVGALLRVGAEPGDLGLVSPYRAQVGGQGGGGQQGVI
jgi:hypothetical protein